MGIRVFESGARGFGDKLAGLAVPLYETVPVPVQLLKLKPAEGVAVTERTDPLSSQLETGRTVPPESMSVVRKN